MTLGDQQSGPRPAKSHKTVLLLVAGAMIGLFVVGRIFFLSPSTPLQATAAGVPAVRAADLYKQLIGFSSAEDLEGKLKFVRNPSRVRRQIEKVGSGFTEPVVTGHSPLIKDAKRGHLHFYWLDVECRGGTTRTVIFEQTNGGLKLDWESFVHYEPVPWARFVTDRTDMEVAAPFRVVCEIDDYFNFAYDDPARYVNVRIMHPASDDVYWGYANRQSETGQSLVRLTSNRRKARVTLDLRRNVNDHPTQLWIEGISSESWLVSP